MTYTGDVTSGGPSDVRDLSTLTIRKASVGPQDNNVYLLTCTSTGEQLLVDAADDAPRLAALVAEGTGGLATVVTTHQHWDHHRALLDVVAATGACTAAGEDDADHLTAPTDVRLVHGDTVRVGEVDLEVIALRGHTPGSVALLHRDPEGHPHLFTGDSLFPGGVGNTQGDAARFASLISDVETRLFDALPDETWVYPGHGPDTHLGAERPAVAQWRSRGW
jgi:glyoxylase-like metal-dependent hydrolase (beta-lactamase superfamily II)